MISQQIRKFIDKNIKQDSKKIDHIKIYEM